MPVKLKGQSILLPTKLHDWARREAKRLGISTNQYFRTLVAMDNKLKARGFAPPQPEEIEPDAGDE